jgi:hypothetical protein
MIRENENNSYAFSFKGIEYEVFYAQDGAVEIYETNNPGKTGFVFSNEKVFYMFINSITDIAAKNQEKQGGGI